MERASSGGGPRKTLAARATAAFRQPAGSSPASSPWPGSETPEVKLVPTPGSTASLSSAASLSLERRELICSVVGLTIKSGLVLLAGVSLIRLAVAYQDRMERQGELSAVLQIEKAKLAKARERFDHLFTVEGEQRLIREQNHWIAPDRLRVVWQQAPVPAAATAKPAPPFPSVEQGAPDPGNP